MQKIFLYEGRGKNKRLTDVFAMVDDEDYEMLNIYQWSLMKIYHTNQKIYYVRRYTYVNKTFSAVLMHRVILNLSDRSIKGDHINGNGLDNQKHNLRSCTHAQNMSNRKSSKFSTSNYLGVFKTKKGRYTVQTRHEGVDYKVPGSFISEDIAALEYNKLAYSLKGEFARLNSIRWY